MVITFDSSNVAVIAYEILKNRLFDDKKLLGKVSVALVLNITRKLSDHVANGGALYGSSACSTTPYICECQKWGMSG